MRSLRGDAKARAVRRGEPPEVSGSVMRGSSSSETTLAEVASQAGVSKTAAWAALSKRQTNVGLSDVTRARVLRVAKKLKYQRNIIGRSLATRKSFLISLLFRETYELSALAVLRGIQDVLLDREYSLVTYAHGDTVEDEARHIEFSLERRVDGLIVTPALDAEGMTNAERFTALQQGGLPIVQLFNRTLAEIPAVMMDYRAAGRMATEHLIELGHRRIAHFTHAGYLDEQTPGFFADARQRWQGYVQAMEAAGLEPVVVAHGSVREAWELFGAAQHASAVGQLLGHPSRPTAVVCYSDFEAFGLIRSLVKKGVGVPQDISVTGIDDLEVLTIDLPSLTTIAPPLRAIGQAAARMVLARTPGSVAEDHVLTPRMHVRESTGPPNAEAPGGTVKNGDAAPVAADAQREGTEC